MSGPLPDQARHRDMSDFHDWRRAFARQAKADLDTRTVLCQNAKAPECHQLHFLQMACEKLVKAHLFTVPPVPQYLFSSHAVIAKHLPRIVGEYYRRQKGKPLPRPMHTRIRHLSRQIELLAPAVDDAGRVRANCEYPWSGPQETVRCPAVDKCTSIDLTGDYEVRLLLKVLPIAIDELSEEAPYAANGG